MVNIARVEYGRRRVWWWIRSVAIDWRVWSIWKVSCVGWRRDGKRFRARFFFLFWGDDLCRVFEKFIIFFNLCIIVVFNFNMIMWWVIYVFFIFSIIIRYSLFFFYWFIVIWFFIFKFCFFGKCFYMIWIMVICCGVIIFWCYSMIV